MRAMIVVLLLAACASPAFDGLRATVYQNENCGCCTVFAGYARSQGLKIQLLKTDMDAIHERFEVPPSVQSCHTTIIDEYFIEGHVPSEAIEKLLSERPDIKGIALPGMPSGTPGMPGPKTEDWVIYAVEKDGNIKEWMRI